MTPAVIIDDLKKRLQAKELERLRQQQQQQQLKANAESWNKLDAHQEQMLLRRCVPAYMGGTLQYLMGCVDGLIPN